MLRKLKAGCSRLARTPRKLQLLGLALLAVLLFPVTGSSQSRRPEIFGMIGVTRSTFDSAVDSTGSVSLGTALGYGGSIMLPIFATLALDVDIQSSSHGFSSSLFGSAFSIKTRDTLISPSLVWRKGNESLYFFTGAGLGLNAVNATTTFTIIDPFTGQPFVDPITGEPLGSQEIKVSTSTAAFNFKMGIVGNLSEHFLVRGDFLVGAASGTTSVGTRFGVGYRF